MTIQIKKLYNDIDEFDYYGSINKFIKEHNITNTIYRKNSMMINYYIKSQNNLSIIILFPKALYLSDKLKLFDNNLKNNGHVHFFKNLNLNYIMMYNLICLLYLTENKLNTHKKIINKLKYIGFTYNNFYTIKIIVYKHYNNNLPINGPSSPYKTLLRKIFTNNDDELYDFLHISSDDNQVYEYSNIFFNKNTLKFLRKLKCWQLIYFKKSLNIFNDFRNLVYKYSLNECEKILLIDSSVLFSHGIRNLNNISGFILDNNKIITKLNNKYDFKSINNDLILNPKYYYYFLGMKFLKLKYNIKLKLNKNYPLYITDILILKQLYNLKYDFKLDIIKKYINSIKYYLNKYYYIDLSNINIENWINNKFPNINTTNIIENNYKYNNNNNIINYDNYYIDIDISENKYVYPTKKELIDMKYNTNVIIYNSFKPYLYPGEIYYSNKFCKNLDSNHKIKNKNIDNLRILNFNVHNFISRCNQGINPVYDQAINLFNKPRDILKFINLFTEINADVICLQEVVPILSIDIINDITDYKYIRNNFNFYYLNKLMNSIGYKYKIIGSTNKGYHNDDNPYYFLANAIYSKLPLYDSKIYQMNFLNRNFISTTINFNNKKYNIINCHMEYKCSDKYDPILLQFNILHNIIKQNFNYYNVILCGDFNINLYTPHHKYINWKNKTSFIHSNFINTSKDNIYTNFHQNDITDYILLSKKSSIKLIYNTTIETYLSDHNPIICDII